MKKMLKRVGAFAVALASAPVMAEGTGTGITAELVTPYITEGKAVILAVLTAGAVIMASFYIWGLIKRALNRSK